MNDAVESLLREVAAHDGLAAERLAREQAVSAIRMLERRLVEALAGESLRGMVSLVPGGRFSAANVRAEGEHGIDTWLPRDGNEVLVVLRTGELAMAGQDATAVLGAVWRKVEDRELRAQDLEIVTEAIELVLRQHLEKVRGSGTRDSRVHVLATRLRQALGAA